MRTLTHDRLIEVLHYSPETGVFLWRHPRPGIKSSEAGTINAHSGSLKVHYRKIGIDGVQHYAHRLAWFYINKEWPPEVDHINGDGLDNRIANLRAATRAQNAANASAQKSSKSGYRGVFKHSSGKYRAQITKGGRTRSLGYFNSPQSAHEAYLHAAKELHGEYARQSP
jgi:hypothetical protein